MRLNALIALQVRRFRLVAQHVLRQSQNHRPRPSRNGGMKRAAHIFGDARGILDLRGPLRKRREHLPEVDLLKALAVEEAALCLADEQDHRARILPCDMNARTRIRGAGSSRDHANSRLPGELAIGLGHHSGAALLAAGDERHSLAHVIERVDHRKIALARNAENEPGTVQRELIGENSASGSFGCVGHASSLCFCGCAGVSGLSEAPSPGRFAATLSRKGRGCALSTRTPGLPLPIRIRLRMRSLRVAGTPGRRALPLERVRG